MVIQVERAAHGQRTLLEHVRVDHGCFNILVAEQVLDGADVVVGIERQSYSMLTARLDRGFIQALRYHATQIRT